MQTLSTPITPLSKVSLELKVQAPGQADAARPFSFIVGVGSGGLSPFEYALMGKKAGDRVVLEIDPTLVAATFEHLQPPLFGSMAQDGPVTLEARVLSVAEADSREIVKAMAGATGGCGGQCDCGCGIHLDPP